MSNHYTPQFYRNWLENNAREIVSEMPTPFTLARRQAVRDRAIGLVDEAPIIDMVLDNTLNLPSADELFTEHGGQFHNWRIMQHFTAYMAAMADLKAELTVEDKRRQEERTKEQKWAEDRKTSTGIAGRLLPLAEAHAAQDEYIKGTFAGDGSSSSRPFKGCSIGCTIYDAQQLGMLDVDVSYGDRHAVAGLLFGGVRQLANLQDVIFENLPGDDATQWTPRLLRIVANASSRANWNRVYHRWISTTVAELMQQGYMPLFGFLYMAMQRARDLSALVASGVDVCEKDWKDANGAADRWHKASGASPDLATHINSAYRVAREATTTRPYATDIALYAGTAGVPFKRMADLFIEAIAAG